MTSNIVKSILDKFLGPNRLQTQIQSQAIPQIIETLTSFGIGIFPVESVVPFSSKELSQNSSLQNPSEKSGNSDNSINSISVPRFKCSCKLGSTCPSPGKHPANGLLWKQATTTSIDIFRKLSKGKTVNYGVATGRLSEKTNKYLVVVDIDEKDHPLISKLPKTFRYKTGSGGFHFWFWSSEPMQNSQGLIKKVDIRGTGGYVIVPPSIHVSGGKYEMISLPEDQILDFPDFLKQELKEISQLKRLAKKTPRNATSVSGQTSIVSGTWKQLPKTKIQGLGELGKVIVEKNLLLKSNKKPAICNKPAKAVQVLKTSKVPKVVLSRKKLAAKTARKIKKSLKNLTPLDTSWWSLAPVSQMISAIQAGAKVPVGVRNSSLHRFLASERGKGVCLLPDIIRSANSFICHLEDSASFSELEALNVCKSVMKYPAYLQDHKLVNKSYSLWMDENYEVDISVSQLDDLDEIFFSMLVAIPKSKKMSSVRTVSLAEITKLRKDWLNAQEIPCFANYKSQLLAKKLSSLGFEKQRTAKANTWLIDVSMAEAELKKELLTLSAIEARRVQLRNKRIENHADRTEMSSFQDVIELSKLSFDIKMRNVKARAELVRGASNKSSNKSSLAQSPACVMLPTQVNEPHTHPVNNFLQTEVYHMTQSETVSLSENSENSEKVEPIQAQTSEAVVLGPDGKPLTLIEERDEVITTERKHNPADKRYSGHGSTADGLQAMIKAMASLPPGKDTDFTKPNFFFDKERTLDFMETLQVGDVLGVRADMFKILAKKKNKLEVVRRKRSYGTYDFPKDKEDINAMQEELPAKEIDMAFAMASCEILYRNDTPYGMESELSYRVKVKVYADEKGRTYVFKTGKEVKSPVSNTPDAPDAPEKK